MAAHGALLSWVENTFTLLQWQTEKKMFRGGRTLSLYPPPGFLSLPHTRRLQVQTASGAPPPLASGHSGQEAALGSRVKSGGSSLSSATLSCWGVNELLRRVPGSNSRASRRSPSSGPLPSPRPPVLRRVLASHGGRLHSVLTVLSWFSVTLPAHLCVASPLNHPQFTHWSVAPVPSEDCR